MSSNKNCPPVRIFISSSDKLPLTSAEILKVSSSSLLIVKFLNSAFDFASAAEKIVQQKNISKVKHAKNFFNKSFETSYLSA